MKIGLFYTDRSANSVGRYCQFISKDSSGNVLVQPIERIPTDEVKITRFRHLWPRVKVAAMDYVPIPFRTEWKLAAPETFGDGVLTAGELRIKQSLRNVTKTAFSMIKGFDAPEFNVRNVR